ncbi:MAG: DNA methyltransferase [Candidatus Hodarchaeales archaeon]|jgi:DNA modification methylase
MTATKTKKSSKGKGPPNRMNDLTYTEWMRFQKSFFRYERLDSLAHELISFFTKKQWPDGRPSRILTIGNDAFKESLLSLEGRIIVSRGDVVSLPHLLNYFEEQATKKPKYDFILVDLRALVEHERDLLQFLDSAAEKIASFLQTLLVPGRYCSILTTLPKGESWAFPIPWAIAQAMRSNLRLRDEKIGLISENQEQQNLLYVLNFQATDDERPPLRIDAANFNQAANPNRVPLWAIVKSPPRKKEEKYHPAKFPEQLVQLFIRSFTTEGHRVFDPMVGTGSTLIAAAKIGRHSVGLELIPEFANIARKRLNQSHPKKALDEWLDSKDASSERVSRPTTRVLEGDARKIADDSRLSDLRFHYAITSPPYWSVLRNPGSEYQKERRQQALLQQYSEDERDLGNIEDYDVFLEALAAIYEALATKLTPNGHLTVIVKNVKRNHIVYPIAWDLATRLCKPSDCYRYVGATLWCQDDVKVRPFALGIHWVSNVLHHYCLHFQKAR